jgi:ABC-type transport system involved in multi-copper enzyme maturation permease subunit
LGGLFIFFFFCPLLDSLFVEPHNSGEEQIILTHASPITRSRVFFSKLLSFWLSTALFNFLTVVVPFSFFYFWGARHT